MARLFGFISNRTDLGPRLLKSKSQYLKEARPSGQPLGWGVGFFQGNEVLLRRRPLDERQEVDPGRFGDNLKTELAIAHIRLPTIGNLRTENTHPFRYRHWLFAHVGTLLPLESGRSALLEGLPEFLRANVRGDTDSELLFYLVLSKLHEAGHLQAQPAPPHAIRAAIREALSQADALESPSGHVNDLLITDGETLIGVNQSGEMATSCVDTEEACRQLLGSSLNKVPSTHLARARCSLVASHIPQADLEASGFRAAPPQSFLTLTRTTAPDFEAL